MTSAKSVNMPKLKSGKMLPSAKTRQANKHNFTLYYNDLCVLNGLTPLHAINAHLQNRTLDFYGDRLRLDEWTPILRALRSDRHLIFLAVRCRTTSAVLPHADTAVLPHADTAVKAQQCTDRPVLYTRHVMKMLVAAVSGCLAGNTVIKCVELEGLPLSKDDVKEIVKAVSRCSSLQNLSFHRCPLDAPSVEQVCRCVKNLPLIESLDLTGCGVTVGGAHDVCAMLKHQKLTMYDERWKLSLRDQPQDAGTQPGLKRVTLNDNPLLGDKGAMEIIEEITDHIWFKALDMQNCDLTDVAAGVALAMLKTNTWLAIVDLRANDGVSPVLLRLVMQQLRQNNAASPQQYLWISNVKYRHVDRNWTRRPSARGRLRPGTAASSSGPEGRRRPGTAASSSGPEGEPGIPGYAQPRPGPRISARDATCGTRLSEQYQLDDPPYLHTAPPPSLSGGKAADDAKDATIALMSQRLEEVTAAMTSLSKCYETEVERRKTAEAELHRIRSFLGEKGTGNIILNNDTVQDIQDAFDAFARFLETVRYSGLAPRLEEAMQREVAEDKALVSEAEPMPHPKRKSYKSSRRYREKPREKPRENLRRRASAPVIVDDRRDLLTEVTGSTENLRRRKFDPTLGDTARHDSLRTSQAVSRAQSIFTQMTNGDGDHVRKMHKKCGTERRKRDQKRGMTEDAGPLIIHGDVSPSPVCGNSTDVLSSQSSSWSILSELHTGSSTD